MKKQIFFIFVFFFAFSLSANASGQGTVLINSGTGVLSNLANSLNVSNCNSCETGSPYDLGVTLYYGDYPYGSATSTENRGAYSLSSFNGTNLESSFGTSNPKPNGNYYLVFRHYDVGSPYTGGNITDFLWIPFQKTAGVWSQNPSPYVDPCTTAPTQICYTDPDEGDVITSTTTSYTLSMEGYVDDQYLGDDVTFNFDLYRNQNRLAVGPLFAFSQFAPNSDVISIPVGTGYNYESTSTSAFTQIGKYTGRYTIEKPLFSFLGISIGSQVLATKSVTFVVGTSTAIEQLLDNTFIENATSSQAIKDHCNILVSFDFFDCSIGVVSFFFTPSPSVISTFVSGLQENVLNRFPVGYMTDFVGIIATTTTQSLTVINATIPSGIMGSGSNITLDLTGVLDPILNATSTRYNNVSASSTETLFTITNRYWSYILYLLALFYILSRIVGIHLFGRLHHNKKIE